MSLNRTIPSDEVLVAGVGQLRQTILALGDLPTERLPEPARDSLLAALRSRTSRVPVQPGESPDGPSDRPTLVGEDEA